jgi:hypothetical protein
VDTQKEGLKHMAPLKELSPYLEQGYTLRSVTNETLTLDRSGNIEYQKAETGDHSISGANCCVFQMFH